MNISTATVAVWLAFAPGEPPAPAPQPVVKCCGKCGGTGYVRTGDGLARVPCGCPDSCSCKKAKAVPAQPCPTGACPLKK